MEINVPLENGYVNGKYAKEANKDQTIDGKPCVSFPINIQDIPENTKTLALAVLDFDSIPVCGFPWIHWVAANIDGNTEHIPENNSQSQKVAMTNGKNSLAGSMAGPLDPKISHHYTGPVPPNKPHDYTLHVWALDDELPLKDGFWLNEMLHAMKGHIIEKAKFNVPAKD